MKRYIVRTTGKATESNQSFRGQTAIYYYGKGNRCIGACGSHPKALHTEQAIRPYEVNEYGYTRKCDAVRSWIYKNPQNDEHWQTTVDIVEIEI